MNYSELYHHGIKGQKWGIRRYQNPDGTLTPEGRAHYGYGMNNDTKRNGLLKWTGNSNDLSYPYKSLEKDLKDEGIIQSASTQSKNRSLNNKCIDILDKMQNGQSLTEAEKKTIGKPIDFSSPESSSTNQYFFKMAKHLDALPTDEEKSALKSRYPDNEDYENEVNDWIWYAGRKRMMMLQMTASISAERGVVDGTFKTEKEGEIYINKMYNNFDGISKNCPMNTLAVELNHRGIKATAGNVADHNSASTGGLYDEDIREIFGYSRNAFSAKTLKHGSEKKPYIGVDPDNKDIIRIASERMYSNSITQSFWFDSKIRKKAIKFAENTGIPNARFGVLVKGHIFNAKTDSNGKLEFIDGQCGMNCTDPKKFFKNADWFCGMTLFRTDNRPLNTSMLKEFNKNKYGVNGPYFQLG